MITQKEVEEFIRKIRSWRCLQTNEQDEVVSRALSRLSQRLQIAEVPQPVAWLLRAAVFIKKELLRSRTSENGLRAELVAQNEPDRRWNGAAWNCDARTPVASSPRANDAASAMSHALADLTQLDREVALLCGVQGLFPAEAGRILAMSRSTTKSRWDRVRNKLRQHPELQRLVNNSEGA